MEYPKENDLLIFGDMALYTSCKNNTFNGMPLPDIYVLNDRQIIRKGCPNLETTPISPYAAEFYTSDPVRSNSIFSELPP